MEEQLQFSLSGLSVNTVEATAVTSFVTKSCDDDAPKNWQMKLLPVVFKHESFLYFYFLSSHVLPLNFMLLFAILMK